MKGSQSGFPFLFTAISNVINFRRDSQFSGHGHVLTDEYQKKVAFFGDL